MPREVRDPWTRIANLEAEVAELRRLLTEHLDVHKVGGERPPERR